MKIDCLLYRYSLYILENNDLENIWSANQTVIIERGKVLFHFNPKLCFKEIEKLAPMIVDMKGNTTFDDKEVARDSNGAKGLCELFIISISKNQAIHAFSFLILKVMQLR